MYLLSIYLSILLLHLYTFIKFFKLKFIEDILVGIYLESRTESPTGLIVPVEKVIHYNNNIMFLEFSRNFRKLRKFSIEDSLN